MGKGSPEIVNSAFLVFISPFSFGLWLLHCYEAQYDLVCSSFITLCLKMFLFWYVHSLLPTPPPTFFKKSKRSAVENSEEHSAKYSNSNNSGN